MSNFKFRRGKSPPSDDHACKHLKFNIIIKIVHGVRVKSSAITLSSQKLVPRYVGYMCQSGSSQLSRSFMLVTWLSSMTNVISEQANTVLALL